MKKLIIGLFAAGLIVAASSSLYANGTPAPEAVAEGVEISGAVDVVSVYQHDDKDAAAGVAASRGGIGDFCIACNGADIDHFNFLINEVEMDLAKTFGENIRLRADIDFTNLTNTTGASVVRLEQAYVTANLAAGNGIEFLIGSFNAPVGVESEDIRDNWLVTRSNVYRYLRPQNVTGAKLYYVFSDLIDLHFAVVNDLNDNGFADSAIPSVLYRLGFNWGDEGRENTVGISGGGGPESQAVNVSGTTGDNAHWDMFGDLDLMIAASDTVTVAAELAFRQSNTRTSTAGFPNPNQKALGGFAAVNYQASDVWDVTFRTDYLWDINPAGGRAGTASGASTTAANWNGVAEGTLIGGSVGAGYQIADGAKLKLEYRFDYLAVSGPSNGQAAGVAANSDYHSVLAEFAYSF